MEIKTLFSLKQKVANGPFLIYSVDVSHPCIVIFFINNIWAEFAKLLDTSPIMIHKLLNWIGRWNISKWGRWQPIALTTDSHSLYIGDDF